MVYLWLVLLLTALIIGWLLTLFSLPGTWVMVLAATFYAWLMPPDSAWDLSWPAVIILLGLALLGEILEFVASALGVSRKGGSRRGALLAICGSLIGGFIGAGVGLPIPVIGSVVGVLLGASAGALVGAMLGEHWKGRSLHESWQIGQGAFWGRLLGSLAKVAIASAMVAVVIVALASHLFTKKTDGSRVTGEIHSLKSARTQECLA
jgi:uncharacterized protein YqgC (DUF456 family)